MSISLSLIMFFREAKLPVSARLAIVAPLLGSAASIGLRLARPATRGVLTEIGFAGLLRPLQAAVLLLTAAAFWVWRRRIAFDQALILLGFCYVLVIGLNTFLHRYFYFPGLILIALGIGCAAAGPLTNPLTAADGMRRSG